MVSEPVFFGYVGNLYSYYYDMFVAGWRVDLQRRRRSATYGRTTSRTAMPSVQTLGREQAKDAAAGRRSSLRRAAKPSVRESMQRSFKEGSWPGRAGILSPKGSRTGLSRPRVLLTDLFSSGSNRLGSLCVRTSFPSAP